MAAPPVNFSVDVEEWYHAEAVRGAVLRDPGLRARRRVAAGVEWLLELLARHGARGTFFVLGEVAESDPALVRRIAAAGHELACHGLDHQLLFRLDPARFREDLRRAKDAIEQCAGRPVLGFRAPKFSLTDWSVQVLRECGLAYDSSLYACGAHDRYRLLRERPLPEAGCVRAFGNGLAEVTLAMLPVLGRRVPWSGGGFFRVTPYRLWRWGALRILRRDGGFTFFMHPWEIDEDQPAAPGLGAKSRFKHHVGRGRMRRSLERLLTDFSVRPLREAVPAALSRAGTSPAATGGSGAA